MKFEKQNKAVLQSMEVCLGQAIRYATLLQKYNHPAKWDKLKIYLSSYLTHLKEMRQCG